MRNVNEKIPGITSMPIRVYELLKLKLTPENELDEDLVKYSNILDEIKKSKSGWIKIKKISDNGGYLTKNESESGWFAVFAKGMSLYIGDGSHYYYTSNIVDIDWDKKLFLTLNSIYSFEITEYDAKDMVDAIDELISNRNVKHQNN
jgi:hypothetical protein